MARLTKAGAKLSDQVIADFEKWINDGANDPRDQPPTKEELAKATDWKTVLETRKDCYSAKPQRNVSLFAIFPNPMCSAAARR